MLTKKRIALLSALAVALAGCGSSSDDNSNPNPNATTINGFVSNGYWQDAKVCVDRDGDEQCSEGDAIAFTGEKGQYAIPAAMEDIGKYAIVAEVVPGQTKEVDENGKVTGEPILDKMISPKELQGAVTPYTYVVYKEMTEYAKNFEEAVNDLGLRTEELTLDYNTDPMLFNMKKGAKTVSQDIRDGQLLDSIAQVIKEEFSPRPIPKDAKPRAFLPYHAAHSLVTGKGGPSSNAANGLGELTTSIIGVGSIYADPLEDVEKFGDLTNAIFGMGKDKKLDKQLDQMQDEINDISEKLDNLANEVKFDEDIFKRGYEAAKAEEAYDAVVKFTGYETTTGTVKGTILSFKDILLDAGITSDSPVDFKKVVTADNRNTIRAQLGSQENWTDTLKDLSNSEFNDKCAAISLDSDDVETCIKRTTYASEVKKVYQYIMGATLANMPFANNDNQQELWALLDQHNHYISWVQTSALAGLESAYAKDAFINIFNYQYDLENSAIGCDSNSLPQPTSRKDTFYSCGNNPEIFNESDSTKKEQMFLEIQAKLLATYMARIHALMEITLNYFISDYPLADYHFQEIADITLNEKTYSFGGKRYSDYYHTFGLDKTDPTNSTKWGGIPDTRGLNNYTDYDVLTSSNGTADYNGSNHRNQALPELYYLDGNKQTNHSRYIFYVYKGLRQFSTCFQSVLDGKEITPENASETCPSAYQTSKGDYYAWADPDTSNKTPIYDGHTLQLWQSDNNVGSGKPKWSIKDDLNSRCNFDSDQQKNGADKASRWRLVPVLSNQFAQSGFSCQVNPSSDWKGESYIFAESQKFGVGIVWSVDVDGVGEAYSNTWSSGEPSNGYLDEFEPHCNHDTDCKAGYGIETDDGYHFSFVLSERHGKAGATHGQFYLACNKQEPMCYLDNGTGTIYIQNYALKGSVDSDNRIIDLIKSN